MNVLKVIIFITTILIVKGKPTVEYPSAIFELFKNYHVDNKIINGILANVGQFPHQVFLLNEKNTTPKTHGACGGALINSKFVLTAAHCLIGSLSHTVMLGKITLNDGNEPGQLIMQSLRTYSHPNYNSYSNNDVGLVELPQAVTFTNNIKPIRLPRASQINDKLENIDVLVSGWGNTSSVSGVIFNLHWAQLKTISNTECSKYYSSFEVIPSTICSVGPQKQSTCDGDSGGALIRKDADGQFTHIGISSFITISGCVHGNPVGFTRTDHYLTWISSITGIGITL